MGFAELALINPALELNHENPPHLVPPKKMKKRQGSILHCAQFSSVDDDTEKR